MEVCLEERLIGDIGLQLKRKLVWKLNWEPNSPRKGILHMSTANNSLVSR